MKSSLYSRMNKLSGEVGAIIPLVILVIAFSLLNPSFLSFDNIGSILRSSAFIGLVAIGQTLVILTGEIDISVGSVAGLGAISGAWMMTHGIHPALAVLLCILVCAVAGMVNGVLSVKFGIPSFIATIGMLYIAKGFTNIITNGYPIYPLPDAINTFSSLSPLGTSWAFLCFFVLIIVFHIILTKTVYGRNLYVTGDNKEVARLAGISVMKMKLSAFILCSVLSGLAGTLMSFELLTGSPTIGSGWELLVVASVVVGGISLLGGSGSMIGAFIGVMILMILNNGMIFLGINTHWQTVTIGVVMITAVLIDMFNRRKRVAS
ncbi:ABC transporter permease [Paenibacillus sp. GCM10027626]|uniref:ABC transporter permease n=1 Tax=Paenibacillus sp. GCM10027626 TaxID=3273411 RepID=UPI003628A91F